MTKYEWSVVCAEALCREGIENFHPLEIADVGRETLHVTSRSRTRLKAPELSLLPNAITLCKLLCELREALPVGPILVNSWFRDFDYNYRIGGVSTSMHMTCGAADITKVGWLPSEVAEWFDAHEESKQLGIGRYQMFTHIDIRGELDRPAPARWSR